MREGWLRAGCEFRPMTNLLTLPLFVALCLGVGFAGARVNRSALIDWYPSLRKPSWNPPNWVFAPVWTTLYLMMAVAAWRVWCRQNGDSWPMTVFALQLGLNFGWSYLFFGWHRPWLALAEIVALWAAIVATMMAFHPVDPVATALLWPYLLWVTFAAALNYAIARLNSRA
jgi:benzodiazapine receptor